MSTPANALKHGKQDLERPIMSMTKKDLGKVEGAGRIVLILSGRYGQAGDLMADLLSIRGVSSSLHKIEGSGTYVVLPKTRLSIKDIEFLRERFPFIYRYE